MTTDPQTAAEAPLSALEAREKLIREHTVSLHLMGEQLSQIEAWFWGHLADVREAARKELGGPLPDDAAAVPVAAPPTTEQTALRERIAALFRHPPGVERLGDATPGEIADAVLAVLPAPADRAATLREAADALDAHATQLEGVSDDPAAPVAKVGIRAATEWRVAAALLRRMAVEAEQAGGPSREATEPQPETQSDDVSGPDRLPLMAEELCPGFPDRCPNLRTVEPEQGVHLGGVRCGCADAPAVSSRPGTEQEAAAGARIVAHVLATHTDLHCLNCTPPPHGDVWMPVAADELDDGGVCVRCGVDVLIPSEAPQ